MNAKNKTCWKNWGNTTTCNPSKIFTPETKEELTLFIQDAAKNQKKVRVASTGYSWSPLVPTDDYLLFMENFKQVSINKDHTLIYLEAGATVDQVAEFCIKHSVCIPSNVVTGMGDASYGGVIATGSHGSGKDTPCVSDFIEEMTIVDSNGEFRHLSVIQDGQEAMNAARIALGMFGVIYSMKLRVQPMFNVHVQESKEEIGHILENLKELVDHNDYVQMWYNPYTKKVRLHRANETEKPINRNSYAAETKNPLRTQLLQQAHSTALNLLKNDPSQVPDIVRASLDLIDVHDYICNIIHYTYNQDYNYILSDYKIVDIEILYELDDSMESVKKAFEILEQITNEWAKKGKYPLNVDSCFRFIRSSDCTLSPAYGNKRTGLVEIYANNQTPDFPQFAGEVSTAWMKTLPKARPHWAKGFQFMEEAIPMIKETYQSQIERFLKVKDELDIDPDGMFVNEYLGKIFS